MEINNVIDIYNNQSTKISFKNVSDTKLTAFAEKINQFGFEISNKYDDDEHLLKVLNVLKRCFYKLISSILPYDNIIDHQLDEELRNKLAQVKNSYPELFSNLVIGIAHKLKEITESPDNSLKEYLVDFIDSESRFGIKLAIVTKLALSDQEKEIIDKNFPSIHVSFFTANSFRKNIFVYDEVIYIGNPDYFGDYVKRNFNSKYITFLSYDFFRNSITPRNVLDSIDSKGVYSTLFNNVEMLKPLETNTNTQVGFKEKESIEKTINLLVEDSKQTVENSQELVETKAVSLENDRLLFIPVESKVRIFSPMDKNRLVTQVNFIDVEEDDFIIIRNESDTQLIAEVADQYILKEKAEKYRKYQNHWKRKLRFNVEKKGTKKVSDIFNKKYDVRTAYPATVRSWCSDESICPTELPKILKAFEYSEENIKKIYEAMKEIQNAHRQAGRIITNKLMSELTQDISKDLQERGYFTFESNEFNGASFNIEKVISIDHSTHLISPSNVMKIMDIE